MCEICMYVRGMYAHVKYACTYEVCMHVREGVRGCSGWEGEHLDVSEGQVEVAWEP